MVEVKNFFITKDLIDLHLEGVGEPFYQDLDLEYFSKIIKILYQTLELQKRIKECKW